MDLYIRRVLRISTGQVLQTIGYNATQSIPLEILIDSLHKFLQEIARDLHRHVELFNRTEPNLDDVALCLRSLDFNVNDLLEYINHVQPIASNIEIPQLPVAKSSNLNFLKPGSQEVLTRPVHIYEHLPPMIRDTEHACEEKFGDITPSLTFIGSLSNAYSSTISNEKYRDINGTCLEQPTVDNTDANVEVIADNKENIISDIKKNFNIDSTTSNFGHIPSSATREMCSVMMTTGGFISPAIEGRTPEVLIPDFVEKHFGLDAPPTDPPTLSQLHSSPRRTEISLVAGNHSLHAPVKNGGLNISSQLNNPYSLDKKFLKKIKKRTSNPLLPMNAMGSNSSASHDKDPRKRLKIGQKNFTKNGVFKVRQNCINFTQSSQDKYFKKQLKLKQKELRQKGLQKQVETSSIFTGNVSNINTEADGVYRLQKHLSTTPTPTPTPSLDNKITESKEFVPVVDSVYLSSPKSSNQCLPKAKEYDLGKFGKEREQSNLPVPVASKCEEIKLNNEPDRSKLNIFKKISSNRKDRTEILSISATQNDTNTDILPVAASSNTAIIGTDQVISLPSGTTITPAPPSGSGRHVYAPPPVSHCEDPNPITSTNTDGNLAKSCSMLMQRGDLIIHKPKKRGRKPGSKNQPKVLGLTTKKVKKKKALFCHNSTSNMIEPLNLSHNSIANIANIPLGIASTFPIDPEPALKVKGEKKKGRVGKDQNFTRNSGKSINTAKNMTPTKEEFASINQKLLMMDTILQAAPPLSKNMQLINTSKKADQSDSVSCDITTTFLIDQDTAVRIRKEKKKGKHIRGQKQFVPLSNQVQSYKTMKGLEQKTSLTCNSAGFPNIPNMPMFPFYPFSARPGLIPSHNIFSQLPNMQNNPLFMPSLIGFRPLNPPILKEEKELSPPLLHSNEGNYSKVAPLVPDTMKLDISPKKPASSPSISKLKSPLITSCGAKTQSSISGQNPVPDINMTQPVPVSSLVNTIFGDFQKTSPEGEMLPTAIQSSVNSSSSLNNPQMTIEVSSDDELDVGSKLPLAHRTSVLPLPFSEDQSHIIQHNAKHDNDVSIQHTDNSSLLRRNKELRKLKKHGKQSKNILKLEQESYMTNVDNITKTLEITKPEGARKYLMDNPSHMSLEHKIQSERRKDHKKMKKVFKDGKLKKKKDKKDKNKNKDRDEKVEKSEKSEKRKEEKKDKLKKNKKEKKREKQREAIYKQRDEIANNINNTSVIVPKLTLKLGQSSLSPKLLEMDESRSSSYKSTPTNLLNNTEKAAGVSVYAREPSPELARISPLVTRPPKQKITVEEVNPNLVGSGSLMTASNSALPNQTLPASHQTQPITASTSVVMNSVIDIDSNSGGATSSMLPASATILGIGLSMNSSSSLKTNTASAQINATPATGNNQVQQHQASQHSAPDKHSPTISLISETNRPSSYIDAEGNRVWICPACGKVDDGSAMIGCDGCDAWYHWVCVGIFVAPNDNEDWYCRVCIAKKQGIHGGDRKRKRNKKKYLHS